MKAVGKLPLTEDCHHWTRLGEVPWDLQKYWQQRYTIFPYYDSGICLTHDAWYGVTPEPVATQIAHDISSSPLGAKHDTIVDLFAGVGANSIAFAQSGHFSRVIAVELDAATLACAQHNAELYGVSEHITWVLGNSFDFMAHLTAGDLPEELQVDVKSTMLFGSPPWGGPGYRTDEVFDLHTMEPYNLDQMHGAYKALDHALYLPRTSDLRQLARLVPGDEKIEVVQYCVEGASKAMVAYLPAAASTDPAEMQIDAAEPNGES